MPVFRRFLIDSEARGQVTAYYDLKNSVDAAVRTANLLEKSGDFEEWGQYQMDHMHLFATKDYVRDLEKQMKEFREMKTMVRSSSMDADSKRDAILSITQAENQLTTNIDMLTKFSRQKLD